MTTLGYKSLFISDTHLGLRRTRRHLPGGGPARCDQNRQQRLDGRKPADRLHQGPEGLSQKLPAIRRRLLLGGLHPVVPHTDPVQPV
ncbi:MAG: hypothetical protein AB2821_03290 [Candidatus Thiodiazotropha endolucinida]